MLHSLYFALGFWLVFGLTLRAYAAAPPADPPPDPPADQSVTDPPTHYHYVKYGFIYDAETNTYIYTGHEVPVTRSHDR